MADPENAISPAAARARAHDDRLDSWKEIAAYLKRDVTTVQRWEKREGMPVHRHQHDRKGSVYAFRAELEVWARSRNSGVSQEDGETSGYSDRASAAPPTPVPGSNARRWPRLILPLAAAGALLSLAGIWLQHTEAFWKNPVAGARMRTITEFDGVEQAAAISRDGQFVAFLSGRDGQMDVWVTQVGSGQFHNLTRGSAPELVNPSVRTLGFTPDGSAVTFWVRKQDGSKGGKISIWAVPTLGGQPRLYLEDTAEFDWSPDGSLLAYHTPGPGDPLYVSADVSQIGSQPDQRPIFTAPAGQHSHFPLWAPGAQFIYFVQGFLPDKMDIWRIRPWGGAPERITSHFAHVSHPVVLNSKTLLYLAGDPDGSGPWLYSIDFGLRNSHRLSSEPDRYTSLAATADGRHLVVTRANQKRTLWRLRLDDSPAHPTPSRISLTTGTAFAPRLGPNFLIYVSANGPTQSIWKWAGGTGTELWSGQDAQVLGSPAISPDGRRIAFSVRQRERTHLYVVQADGTDARIAAASLQLQGSPAWDPTSDTITSAVDDHGTPRLFRIPLNGGSPTALLRDYSLAPAWAPGGSMLVYSGPDIGTTFSVKAAGPGVAAHPFPALTLTRGARHLAFLTGGQKLVFLQGDIRHKNLWLLNLENGGETQLTQLPADFDINEFDISPDGHDVVLERVEDRSDVMLLDLAR